MARGTAVCVRRRPDLEAGCLRVSPPARGFPSTWIHHEERASCSDARSDRQLIAMRWPGNSVWLAAAVLAIGAEWLALPGTTGGAAAADLVAGATILFAGLVAWRFSPDSLLGPLLAAAGVSWFVGTVATAHVGFIAAIGALAVTLHRGPLVHAVLCYPSGRLAGRLVGVVVVIAYLCAVVTPLGENRAATATLVVLLAATSVRGYATGGMAERRVRRTNLTGSALLSFALLLVVGAGHWEASGFSSAMILGAYEVSLAGLVLALVNRPHSPRFERAGSYRPGRRARRWLRCGRVARKTGAGVRRPVSRGRLLAGGERGVRRRARSAPCATDA